MYSGGGGEGRGGGKMDKEKCIVEDEEAGEV